MKEYLKIYNETEVARMIAPSGSNASERGAMETKNERLIIKNKSEDVRWFAPLGVRGAMEIKNESKVARMIVLSGSNASERGTKEIKNEEC